MIQSVGVIISQSKLSLNSEANAADQWKDPFLVFPYSLLHWKQGQRAAGDQYVENYLCGDSRMYTRFELLYVENRPYAFYKIKNTTGCGERTGYCPKIREIDRHHNTFSCLSNGYVYDCCKRNNTLSLGRVCVCVACWGKIIPGRLMSTLPTKVPTIKSHTC